MNWTLRDWLGWIAIALIGAGVIYWGHAQSSQNKTIRIATAVRGGYYYEFGRALKEQIEKYTEYNVEVLDTQGSIDNRSRLLAGNADFAIMQSAVPLDGLAAIAPLWDDYVHVIVRTNSTIKRLQDLSGHHIAIGKAGSGFRANAVRVLEHYSIDPDKLLNNNQYFTKLLEDPSLEGAIVTTGFMNPDFVSVMSTGNFRLLTVDAAEGFAFRNGTYKGNIIPTGMYSSVTGPQPETPIKTVSTQALFMSRTNAPYDMVAAVMPVLFSLDLRDKAPLLVNSRVSSDAMWSLLPMHPASRSYMDPYDGIGMISDFFSFLSRFKELILLLILGAGVLWYQLGQRGKRTHAASIKVATRQLEKLLIELARIESLQKEAKDVRVLRQYLDEVAGIKSKGFEFAMKNHVHDTVLFLAFLQQSIHVMDQVYERLSLSQESNRAS